MANETPWGTHVAKLADMPCIALKTRLGRRLGKHSLIDVAPQRPFITALSSTPL
jgi:hypothetical protein